MRPRPILAVVFLVASGLAAQTQGSYVRFGNGCPGTGGPPTFPGIIVPSGHDVKFGNSQQDSGVCRANERYQQVFFATHIGRSQAFIGYQLRPDQAFPSTSGGTQTYSVWIGYTLKTPVTMTFTFANQYDTSHGPPTLVFSGTVNLPPVSGTPELDDWSFTVRFSAPWVFVYNPSENLLLELTNSSTTGVAGQKDAVFGVGSNTSRLFTNNSTTATSGVLFPESGLVIKFISPGQVVGAIPILAATGVPSLGQPLGLTLSRATANTAAGLVLGASDKAWGPFSLPLDLTLAGAGGCSLLVSLDIVGGIPVDGSGTARASLPIPNDTRLRGGVFHNQWMIIDPGANALGIAFSNGGTATIGG